MVLHILLILLLIFTTLGFAQNPPSTVNFSTPPPSPVASVNATITGNGGSATYYYWVIATYPIGKANATSVIVRRAPNTLTATNSITITWTVVPNAINYDVLRTTTPNLPSTCSACAISLSAIVPVLVDTGLAGAAYSLTTAGTATGFITLDNSHYSTPTFRITPNIDATWDWVTQVNGKPFVDARVYGCKGDGVTDDTKCLQSAINAAIGGRLVIPKGMYITSAPLTVNVTVNRSIDIMGVGYSPNPALYGTGVYNSGVGVTLAITSDNTDTYIGIHDLGLFGTTTIGNAITCTNCTGLRIARVYANTGGSNGISCTNCFGASVRDSFFYNYAQYGGSFTATSNAITIDNTAMSGNCKVGPSCGGLRISSGQQINVINSRFEGNGTAPIGALPTFAVGSLFGTILGLKHTGNYYERNLTHAIYVGAAVTGFAIGSGDYIQDSGIMVDTARNGSITDSVFRVFANPLLNINNVIAGGAGRCRYTTATDHNLTANAFVNVTGILGATACNGLSTVAAVINTTTFETFLAFGAAYVGAGNVIQATGINLGTVGNHNIRVQGNDLTDANTYMNGFLQPGIGPNIVSAATITPTYAVQHVTGAAVISTITVPLGFVGTFCAIPDGAFTTNLAGNIGLASAAVVGRTLCWSNDNNTALWYPSY